MKKALYQQIEEYILDSIRKHEIREGEGLPSERDLARMFKSSHIPVRRACQNLVDRGVLYRISGKGTFVKPHEAGGRKKSTRWIGILHCHGEAGFINSMFYAPILAGIENELHGHDRVPMIASLFKDRRVFSPAYGMADEVEGFILVDAMPAYEEQIVNTLREFKRPVVMLNYAREFEGIDSIVMDNYGSMKKMATMLAEQGHTRIAYLYAESGDVAHPTNRDRIAGYRDALAAHGISPDGQLEVNLQRLKDKAAVVRECRDKGETPPLEVLQGRLLDELLALPDPPTVLMCAYDELAVRVIGLLRTRGIRVPEDVCVTGHDDTVIAAPTGLTTVYTPLIDMGKRAVRRLLEKIEEKREGTETVSRTVLPGELVLRTSHGQLRQQS